MVIMDITKTALQYVYCFQISQSRAIREKNVEKDLQWDNEKSLSSVVATRTLSH